MSYHPIVAEIKQLLLDKKVGFETFEHEPVRTSEEAAKIRIGYTLEQGAKALILKTKPDFNNSQFVMFVMPAHLKLSSSKVKIYMQVKDLRFATPEEIGEITGGVQVGGVPPFGNLFNIPVIVDSKLFENEKIVFNAGDRSFSIGMKSSDFKTLFEFRQADITE